MNASRTAAWLFVAAVCGAWLASAAGVTRQARASRITPRAADAVQFDALAADVQAQAGRLRERLASAPTPRTERNPFGFSPRPRGASAVVRSVPAANPAPVVEVREPVLELVGVAESTKADGIIRTAMITGGADALMMVTAGQRILGRYDVVAVDADAVELKDLLTGSSRRLVIR